MVKKMSIYGLLIFGVWFILQNFTLINVSVKLLFVSSQDYPELQDGLGNETIVFDRIQGRKLDDSKNPESDHLSTVNSIAYFPVGDFYVIRDYKHSKFYKIDSLGAMTYEFGMEDITSKDFSFIAQGLAFTEKNVYDLREDKPIAQRFEEIGNETLEFTADEWNRTFKKLYAASSAVIYNDRGDLDNQIGIIYFHHQNKWIKLFSLNRNTIISQHDKPLNIRLEGEDFYAKHPVKYQSYYLKDSTAQVFSNYTRTSDQDVRTGAHNLPFESIADPELDYPRVGKIRIKGFKKKDYLDHYLLPKIPVEVYGEAYYQLFIGDKILKFKSNASKTMFGKVQTDLYVFGPPKEFEHRNKVRFLAYDYSTNFLDNGKKGVYVIRIK